MGAILCGSTETWAAKTGNAYETSKHCDHYTKTL